MSTRNLALWLRIVLAALVLALGSGAGLPGIVRAMAPAQEHVCTCASAGSHGSCPVCSGSQNVRSRYTQISGVPCGERLVPFGSASEPAVIWPPVRIVAAPFAEVSAGSDILVSPDTAVAEPPTPPPRFVSA